MTYSQTCERFGINKVNAFERLFENNPYTILELDKLIEKNDQDKKNWSLLKYNLIYGL